MTASDLKQLALSCSLDSSWDYLHRPDIAPDGVIPERSYHRRNILPNHPYAAPQCLNAAIYEVTLDEVARQLAKPERPSLILSNRAFHEVLVAGVPVEGDIDRERCGDRVQVPDQVERRSEEWSSN